MILFVKMGIGQQHKDTLKRIEELQKLPVKGTTFSEFGVDASNCNLESNLFKLIDSFGRGGDE